MQSIKKNGASPTKVLRHPNYCEENYTRCPVSCHQSARPSNPQTRLATYTFLASVTSQEASNEHKQ